jgi:hypothetical protein
VGIFRRFRAVFAFVALAAVTGCTTWRPYEGALGPTRLPSSVRVTLDTGEELALVRPRVLSDTLLVGRATRHGPESLVVPVSSISLLKAKRLDPAKTWAFALLTTIVAVPVGYLAYSYAAAH